MVSIRTPGGQGHAKLPPRRRHMNSVRMARKTSKRADLHARDGQTTNIQHIVCMLHDN